MHHIPTQEEAIHKVEEQMRKQMFGSLPPEQRAAAEAQKDQEWKQTHPDSQGFVHDQAVAAYQQAIQAFSQIPGPDSPERKQLQQRLENQWLHRTPPASAPAQEPAAQREQAIHALEERYRGEFFGEGPTPGARSAAEHQIDRGWRGAHPGSQGFIRDFATQAYDQQNNPALTSEALKTTRDQLASIAAHSPGGSIQQRILQIITGMIDGTAPGMQPIDSNAPAPPAYEPKPQGISGDEIRENGHRLEHQLANFIRAHQQESPTHTVDLGRIAAVDPGMHDALVAYGNWENRRAEINAHSSRPEAVSPDLALIRQNNYAAFVSNHAADPRTHELYIAPQEIQVYRSLSALSDEADKSNQTMESFGITARPKAVPTR